MPPLSNNDDNQPSVELNVPIIDLQTTPEDQIVQQIAQACQEFGFFQIVHHSVAEDIIDDYLEQCRLYFQLPLETKQQWKRHDTNSRGWFNDELTKQKRDWKEALDMGVPGTRDWNVPDDDASNHCLDGWNQLPSVDILPDFRKVVTQYFDECAKLADRIAVYMAKGLGQDGDHPLLQELRDHHSSYLRSNYYPLCNELDEDGVTKPLGISPHRDAGFLTVLLQDADCHSLQVSKDDEWVTIHPASKYAFTINTGDMAEVWSNGRYKAPLHRVLSHETQERYSTPFFYNPSYNARVEPLSVIHGISEPHIYHGVLWGYFRAVRFAGDLTDLGVEIQVADFLKSHNHHPHLEKQEVFAQEADFNVPFSVEKYKPLLQGTTTNNPVEAANGEPKKRTNGKGNSSLSSSSLLTILTILSLLATSIILKVDASTRSTLTSRNLFNKERTGVSGFGSRSIKKTIFPVSDKSNREAGALSPLTSLRGDDDQNVVESDDEEDSEESNSDDSSSMEDSETMIETLAQQNEVSANLADVCEDPEELADNFDILNSGNTRELWVQRSDEDPSVLWVRIGSNNKLTLKLSVSADTGDWQVERKCPSRSFLKQYPVENWVPIEGFYGLYRVPSGILWVLVSKTEPVYQAPPMKSSSSPWLKIRRVVNLEIVHLNRPNDGKSTLTPLQLREEVRQLKLLRKALKQHDFYYIPQSGDSSAEAPFRDMTKTLQRSILQESEGGEPGSSMWWRTEDSDSGEVSHKPDPRFFWNQHAVEPLLQRYQAGTLKRNLVDAMLQNVVPLTSAFVGVQQNITVDAGTKKPNQLISYDELLISRRSRFRAGTRFTVRGADATGAVANFVETEQLCLVTSTNEPERRIESVASHVQIRGSIPLRWSSPADVKTYRPRVHIGTDPVAQARALRLHLLEQLSLYAPENAGGGSKDIANIVFVNLVDKKSDQGRLGKAFDAVLQAVLDVYSNSTNDTILPKSKASHAVDSPLNHNSAQHLWYDFHAEVKEGRWDRLSMLLEEVQPSLESHGYFHATAPTDEEEWSIKKLQNAVVRTNCMDCLDRTNVVQSIFGRYMLFHQLSAIAEDGLSSNAKKKAWTKMKNEFDNNALALPWESGERAHRMLWADNADAISRLYAGTSALKGDFTRTGKRTKKGALDDGMNSLQRYYLNNFLDADRQEGYDLMVGYANFSNMGELPLEVEIEDEEQANDANDPNSTEYKGSTASHPASKTLRESVRGAMLRDVMESTTFQKREDVRSRLKDIGVQSNPYSDTLDETLDLRWLPGDLQTHLRSQASEASASQPNENADNTHAKKTLPAKKGGFQIHVALRAIDERSTHIVPWWTESTEDWLAIDSNGSDYTFGASQGPVPNLSFAVNTVWMTLVLVLGTRSPSLVAGTALALLLFVYSPTVVRSDWQRRSELVEGLLARLSSLNRNKEDLEERDDDNYS